MSSEHGSFLKTIKHHLLTVSFVAGFAFDNLTLSRVDKLYDNAFLFSYVLVSMIGVFLLYFGTSGKRSERFRIFVTKWAPLLIQYMFGGLMSGLLVFYSRAGSWWAHWPYLLIIVGMILGNELIHKKAQRLVFNLGLLFIGMFSYAALVVPVVLGKMGDSIFLLSGGFALAVFVLFLRLLYFVIPNFMALNTRNIFFTIAMLYATLNGLYFLNIIPPIPLSMKEMGIYHEVLKRDDGGYALSYEEGSWYELWHLSDSVFHYKVGDRVYCYTSIFAPSRLHTDVVHKWEYYDAKAKKWTLHEKVPFSIDGGRGEGYRGFSYIESVQDGTWRCSAETPRGQVIGRATFTVVTGMAPKPLVSRVDTGLAASEGGILRIEEFFK